MAEVNPFDGWKAAQAKDERSSFSTEYRSGRSERRNMRNEIPPTCVYLCWSTDQEEGQRCGFLHKANPGRCKRTGSVLIPPKKFAFASAETKSTYNSVCVARTTGDFSQENHLKRRLRRQLKRDGGNQGTSRAKKFEKAWESKNSRKAYALLKQYTDKMKRCFQLSTLPMEWLLVNETFEFGGGEDHIKTLLNLQAQSTQRN
ncbi:hypothetical protein RB195_023334 [Necator americanus]|uniref:Uncharacterized protein n=1 Tax=Necator americanus TaxID=51031 RepID=A0ABR1EL97_NECAM